MSYKKSQSRIDFEQGTISLKRVTKKISFKSSPLTYEQKQLIYQSAIFLMSPKIESYSESLIENIVFNYKSREATINELPDNIITRTIIDRQLTHYKNFINNSDERKLLENINHKNPYYKMLNDDEKICDLINAGTILATNKYPSLKNMKILYFRIGIQDIIKEIQIKGKKNYKDQLESFLSVREAIAHQEAPALTFQDIERHLNNLLEIINNLDRVVYSHITKVSGEKYW